MFQSFDVPAWGYDYQRVLGAAWPEFHIELMCIVFHIELVFIVGVLSFH